MHPDRVALTCTDNDELEDPGRMGDGGKGGGSSGKC